MKIRKEAQAVKRLKERIARYERPSDKTGRKKPGSKNPHKGS